MHSDLTRGHENVGNPLLCEQEEKEGVRWSEEDGGLLQNYFSRPEQQPAMA